MKEHFVHVNSTRIRRISVTLTKNDVNEPISNLFIAGGSTKSTYPLNI